MSKLSTWLLAGIAFSLALAVLCASDGDGNAPLSTFGASASIGILCLLLAAWFLNSFVLTALPSQGAEREKALTDIYAFAYTFTLLALALLALPFGNLLSEGSFPDKGPIRLLRGCVIVDSPSTAEVKAAGAAPPASAASGATGSKTEWPKGLPVCGPSGEEVHTVLVTIGGVIARAAPAPLAFAPSSPASKPLASVYHVRDGFVVPILMIVFAIVGAVVNLMRRVPEFQKRAHVDFVGTDKEPPLQPYEAREFVAFQILQLIAAPFIAMVAIYVIAPQTLASAIGLAFVSGLFSEGVLLRIRALVEGPEKTQTQAATQALGELEISVKDIGNGAVLAGVTVTVTQIVSGKKVNEAVTDALGLVVLKAVSIGKLRIAAELNGPPLRQAVSVDMDLAAGQRKRVDLSL